MTSIFEYVVDKIITSFKVMLSLSFDIYGFEVSFLSLNLAILISFALIKFMRWGFFKEVDVFSSKLKHGRSENIKEKRLQKK